MRRLAVLIAVAVLGVAAVPSASAIPGDGAEGPDYEPAEPLDVQWIEGGIETHYGQAFNGGLGGVGLVLKSDLWYTNEAGNAQSPRVGETWTGVVHVGVFDPNPGKVAVEFVVKLPPNTSFAIDAKHKIGCSRIPEGGGTTFIDSTKDPAANCPAAPTLTPEGWSLGTRELAKFTQFAIEFPLKSTAALKGSSGPNGGDRLRAIVRPQFADTKEPYVDVNVVPPPPPRINPELFLSCFWNNPNNPGPC